MKRLLLIGLDQIDDEPMFEHEIPSHLKATILAEANHPGHIRFLDSWPISNAEADAISVILGITVDTENLCYFLEMAG